MFVVQFPGDPSTTLRGLPFLFSYSLGTQQSTTITSLCKYCREKMPSRCEICCEILIAILLPPLGVCFRHGCCSVEFWICLLLTILGYVPGIIYALYAIVFIDREEYFDEYRRPLYAPAYQ